MKKESRDIVYNLYVNQIFLYFSSFFFYLNYKTIKTTPRIRAWSLCKVDNFLLKKKGMMFFSVVEYIDDFR